MKHTITQDALGTHIDWQHDGVTARMIDWFWSNMEKGFLLWHPEEYEPLTWAIPPQHGNLIGAIHIAPQTWSDGTRQNLYIRFEELGEVPADVKQFYTYLRPDGLGRNGTSNYGIDHCSCSISWRVNPVYNWIFSNGSP